MCGAAMGVWTDWPEMDCQGDMVFGRRERETKNGFPKDGMWRRKKEWNYASVLVHVCDALLTKAHFVYFRTYVDGSSKWPSWCYYSPSPSITDILA